MKSVAMGLALIFTSVFVPTLASLPIKNYAALYPNGGSGGLGFGLLYMAGFPAAVIIFIIGCRILSTSLEK